MIAERYQPYATYLLNKFMNTIIYTKSMQQVTWLHKPHAANSLNKFMNIIICTTTSHIIVMFMSLFNELVAYGWYLPQSCSCWGASNWCKLSFMNLFNKHVKGHTLNKVIEECSIKSDPSCMTFNGKRIEGYSVSPSPAGRNIIRQYSENFAAMFVHDWGF